MDKGSKAQRASEASESGRFLDGRKSLACGSRAG